MKFISNPKGKQDVAFNVFNTIIMLIICFITLYPIWYCVVLSFNQGSDAVFGGIYWWPRKFSLENYKAVFMDSTIIRAFGVTTCRTIIATSVSVFFTAMVAYSISKKELMFRNTYLILGIITLFFGGGLIPGFILIKKLGLYDNFLVYIIPAMFNFYNLLIFQAFFRQIPHEIEEAAAIDGANDIYVFLRIILPLSMPLLATMALFAGVYHWNDYFTGFLYIKNQSLIPIQTFLFKIIAESSASANMQNIAQARNGARAQTITPESIKLATMVVTTMPIIFIYPFLQKYFVKGMLIGSVKG